MNLTFVPLLNVQRDLYALPRNMDRFDAYLRTLIDADSGDLKLPLVVMNPMGKEHLPPFLDDLLAIDADGEGGRATANTQAALLDSPGDFRVSLVVVDDLMGGWTNRYADELKHRRDAALARPAVWNEPWITAWLWTSERYTAASVREEVLTCIYRAAYIRQHGVAQTLASLLTQEGEVMARAGAKEPRIDDDDLAYTRAVLEPLLAEGGEPTLVAALFGDDAARELGYTPLGLSGRAGLALALADAVR